MIELLERQAKFNPVNVLVCLIHFDKLEKIEVFCCNPGLFAHIEAKGGAILFVQLSDYLPILIWMGDLKNVASKYVWIR